MTLGNASVRSGVLRTEEEAPLKNQSGRCRRRYTTLIPIARAVADTAHGEHHEYLHRHAHHARQRRPGAGAEEGDGHRNRQLEKVTRADQCAAGSVYHRWSAPPSVAWMHGARPERSRASGRIGRNNMVDGEFLKGEHANPTLPRTLLFFRPKPPES